MARALRSRRNSTLKLLPSTYGAKSTAVFENGTNETQIKCGEVRHQVQMTATAAKQLRMLVEFYECWNGKNHIEIHTLGCFFLWSAPVEAGKAGAIQIDCEPGYKIELTAGLCTATAGPQTVGKGATYSNFGKGSSRDFLASIDATEIHYEFAGFNCTSVFGNGKDGRLTSAPTVEGFSTKSELQSGVWVE